MYIKHPYIRASSRVCQILLYKYCVLSISKNICQVKKSSNLTVWHNSFVESRFNLHLFWYRQKRRIEIKVFLCPSTTSDMDKCAGYGCTYMRVRRLFSELGINDILGWRTVGEGFFVFVRKKNDNLELMESCWRWSPLAKCFAFSRFYMYLEMEHIFMEANIDIMCSMWPMETILAVQNSQNTR
jgi:hypothetical protein